MKIEIGSVVRTRSVTIFNRGTSQAKNLHTGNPFQITEESGVFPIQYTVFPDHGEVSGQQEMPASTQVQFDEHGKIRPDIRRAAMMKRSSSVHG